MLDGNDDRTRHTQLTPLEPLQFSPASQQLLDGCDVFLLLEARKQLEVFLRLEKGLGIRHLLLDGATTGCHCVDDCSGLGKVQRGDIVEFAEFELAGGFFVAGWWALWTRCCVRDY